MKQKRIYYDNDSNLILYEPDAKVNYVVIACFWVLLDFIDKAEFHTLADYPSVICFFAKGNMYEIVFVPIGQEIVLSHAFQRLTDENTAKRIVIVEKSEQIYQLNISNTVGYCKVQPNGSIEYYQLQ